MLASFLTWTSSCWASDRADVAARADSWAVATSREAASVFSIATFQYCAAAWCQWEWGRRVGGGGVHLVKAMWAC